MRRIAFQLALTDEEHAKIVEKKKALVPLFKASGYSMNWDNYFLYLCGMLLIKEEVSQ